MLDKSIADIDFNDIEIPDPSDFHPEQWKDDRHDIIRLDGTIYEGNVRNSLRNGEGTLYDENREQYVTGKWENNKLMELHFAQFLKQGTVLRIYGWDQIITCSQYHFIARINMQSIDMFPNHFPTIRKEFESKITIVKILDDDLKTDLDDSRKNFTLFLTDTQNSITTSKISQRNLFHLSFLMDKMAEYYDYQGETENSLVLYKIFNNDIFTQELKDEAEKVYETEHIIINRNKILPIMKLTEIEFSWKNIITAVIKQSIANFKYAILNVLPSKMFISSALNDINTLSNMQLLSCNIQDIQLFSDLELTIHQHAEQSDFLATNSYEFIENYIKNLWSALILKIKNAAPNDTSEKFSFTNPVFLQLFKTFYELLKSLCDEDKISIQKVIKLETDLNITFLGKKNVERAVDKSIKYIISLLNMYKPGYTNTPNVTYDFQFFQTKTEAKIDNIIQEKLIWLYYIHLNFSFIGVEKTPQKNQGQLFTFLNNIMELFINVIKTDTTLEKLRILSNSIIKLGVTISPYFLEQNVKQEDMDLLNKQAKYIYDLISAKDQDVHTVENIMDIYQVFWEENKLLKQILFEKYNIPPIVQTVDDVLSKTNKFNHYILDQKYASSTFLNLLRSYNEFIRLLRSTNFPWYVKTDDTLKAHTAINCVEEYNANTHSYIVKDIRNFISLYQDHSKVPGHYLLRVTIHFIEQAHNFFSSNKFNKNDNIEACSKLLSFMGRSLIHFNKLPDAIDFENFSTIFVEPFNRVIKNPTDLKDFKKRLNSLSHFYKYTMELNVMSITKAIDLCQRNASKHSHVTETNLGLINYAFDLNIYNITKSYRAYLNKFNSYVEENILERKFKIENLVKAVKSSVRIKDISEWDSRYKSLDVPIILAGLSAIWSALESEDIIYQKQVMKPHVIQILCILRLLGVDQSNNGFLNHVAQVLTGQGKSLILSLLAALLAITGNRVRIVCYNKHLATRDQQNFHAFYEILDIADKINYGTFDDMADEILNPTLKGENYNLRTFVEKILTNELPHLFTEEKDNFVSKTILLIDEVDVFFSPQFYGKSYNPVSLIKSEGLADLQIKIWNLTQNNTNVVDVKTKAMSYINETVIKSTDTIFVNIYKYSKLILELHVDQMVSNAVSVRESIPGDWYNKKYRLREDGLISTVELNGEHRITSFYAYKNVFMYFKLKADKFEHKDFHNYGYLNVRCGSISYARLPNGYRTILGVSGTLTQLSNPELKAVNSYNIKNGSDMPTFFGENKLIITGTIIKDTADEWMSSIIRSILKVVQGGRAVIVFFEDEYIIEKYRSKFESHLSRYVVLTGNEEEDKLNAYVTDAGVAQRVTIATRGMGRGIDFQSNDSAVENKGGIHIIQTFFSDDLKEETQIKGRTARKDNKGSYEAIFCREHLNSAGYKGSTSDYKTLHEKRVQKSDEKGTQLAENIIKSKMKHNATMEFLNSFFRYNPDNRDTYFTKYPFVDGF